LIQNKYAKHAPKVQGVNNERNKFFQVNKPIAVKYHDSSIPSIKNAFLMKDFSESNPNTGGSNIRVGKRTGVQFNGRSAIRKFKKVSTREVDPLTVYLNYCGYTNSGIPRKDAIKTFSEKIIKIESDGLHTGYVMLVAGNYPGHAMRWRIAPHGVKVGDVLETTLDMEDEILELKQGNSHPIGVLPIGTPVCMINEVKDQIRYKAGLMSEMGMRWGANLMKCKNAGAHGFVIKQEEKYTYVHIPFHHNTHTIKVENSSICTIGRVSNPGWLKSMRGITKSKNARWYLGRKVKGGKPSRVDLRYRRGRAKHGFKSVLHVAPKIIANPKSGFLKSDEELFVKTEPHVPSILRYKMKAQQADYDMNKGIGMSEKPKHGSFLK